MEEYSISKFNFIYFFFTIIIYLLSIPILLIVIIFIKQHRFAILSRFFLFKNQSLKSNGIWFHGASYGEIRSLYPLINSFQSSEIRVSTTTETGFNAIPKDIKEKAYLPFEIFLPFWIKSQKIIIVTESELWYFLFLFSKIKKTKTVLINARMSEKSYKKYKKLLWLYKPIFSNIDEIYAQGENDKIRLENLGGTNIEVIGNIKILSIISNNKIFKKPKGLLICAGSTHEEEEKLILKAFENLKKIETDTKIIIAPRYPHRFDKVKNIIQNISKKNNYSYSIFSENMDFSKDIILLDVLGELINSYFISDLVIIGGSFIKKGGHNPLEAAQFNCKIISGEYNFNQKALFEQIEGVKISPSNELSKTLINYKLIPKTTILKNKNIDTILNKIKKHL